MKRIVLKLTRSVKRRIERMMHKTTDARLRDRGRIVLLYHRGLGCNEIAETVGCAPATAVRVANRFLNYGEAALEDQRKENGCPKVDPDLLEGLIQILSNSPQDFGYIRATWTQELLALVLAEQTGVVVSGRTVARMLGTLNARWGRPRPIVESPVSKARKTRRIRRIERLIENLPRTEVAVYVDEVDIHLNPKIGRDWMLPGTQKIVVTPGVNKKQYVAGALNAKTGEIVYVTAARKNSELFIKLLQKLREVYPKAKRIHLILDNYIIHSSRKAEIALRAFGGVFERHFLPPYTPEHNLIEHLWKQLHDNVTRNHRRRSIEGLMRDVEIFLKRASPFPGAKPSTAKSKGRRRKERHAA